MFYTFNYFNNNNLKVNNRSHFIGATVITSKVKTKQTKLLAKHLCCFFRWDTAVKIGICLFGWVEVQRGKITVNSV